MVSSGRGDMTPGTAEMCANESGYRVVWLEFVLLYSLCLRCYLLKEVVLHDVLYVVITHEVHFYYSGGRPEAHW